MPGPLIQEYRLLTRPYRVALWSIMGRFKTRLVEQTATRFIGSDDMDAKVGALEKIRNRFDAMHEAFLRNEANYESHLAAAIHELIEKGVIETKGTVVEDQSHLAIRAARRRTEQVERYLHRVKRLWSQVSASDRSDDRVFAALSESVSPFYGVVYDPESNYASGRRSLYHLAIWSPHSKLLSLPYLSGRRAGVDVLKNLCLCPTMITSEPDTAGGIRVLDGDHELAALLDLSTEAYLDFEKPELITGWIQELVFDPKDRFYLLHPLGDSEQYTGRFTDLFWYLHDVMRYVITDEDSERDVVEASAKAEPKGILFISTPSVEALQCLVTLDDTQFGDAHCKRTALQHQIWASWVDVGGNSLVPIMYEDFGSLRTKYFRDLAQSYKAPLGRNIIHNAKINMNVISGLIREARSRDAADPAEALWNAQQITTFIAHDYALRENLHDLRLDQIFFERLSEEQLSKLIPMMVAYHAAVHQVLWNDLRTYFVNGESMDSIAPSILVKRIGEALDCRVGIDDIAKQPDFAALFFMFNELIANTRPRSDEIERPRAAGKPTPVEWLINVKIDFSPERKIITLTQCVASSESPFGAAQKARSILERNHQSRSSALDGRDTATFIIDPKEPYKRDGNWWHLDHILTLSRPVRADTTVK
jgi:hypothetical protein